MRRAALALAAALLPAGPAAAFQCHIALVLALDASRSVDAAEARLQRGGLAAALRDPEIRAALAPAPGAGAALMAFEWSEPGAETLLAPWTLMESDEDVTRFADLVEFSGGAALRRRTGLGPALRFAAQSFARAPARCARLVIDVSGDGPSNAGRPPEMLADDGALDGIVINGLAIRPGNPAEAELDLLAYYTHYVIHGPGAFAIPADGFEDYARAIRTKLLKELQPALALR